MAERVEIIKCTCNHTFQDEVYGQGNRVHNVNDKGQAFCTVCSPSYRRNKVGTDVAANPIVGNTFVPARKNRNPKTVPK